MIGSRCHVLLVEDDAEDAWLTEQMLREIPDGAYHVHRSASIEAARESIRRKSYDALLVDHYLPDGNGLEFIQECTAAGLGIPMILLTGRGDSRVDRDALQAGAADYLLKGDLNGTLLDRALRYSMNQMRSMTLLHESEQFLMNALNSLSGQVAILNESGTILAVNEQWKAFSRKCKKKFKADGIGTNYLEVCREPERGGDEVTRTVTEAIKDIRDGKWSVFSLDFACTTADGPLWFNLHLSAFIDKGEKRITIEHRDITEGRKELNAAVQNQNQLRFLADSIDDIILLVDGSRSIVYANSAIERITGAPVASVIGRPAIQLISDEDRPRMIRLRGRPDRPKVDHCQLLRVDGSLVPAQVTIADRLADPEMRAKVVIFRPLVREAIPDIRQ